MERNFSTEIALFVTSLIHQLCGKVLVNEVEWMIIFQKLPEARLRARKKVSFKKSDRKHKNYSIPPVNFTQTHF